MTSGCRCEVVMNGYEADEFATRKGRADQGPARDASSTRARSTRAKRDPGPPLRGDQAPRLGARDTPGEFRGITVLPLGGPGTRHGPPGVVHVGPAVPRAECVALQQSSDIQLLLMWNDPGEGGQLHRQAVRVPGIWSADPDDGLPGRSRGPAHTGAPRRKDREHPRGDRCSALRMDRAEEVDRGNAWHGRPGRRRADPTRPGRGAGRASPRPVRLGPSSSAQKRTDNRPHREAAPTRVARTRCDRCSAPGSRPSRDRVGRRRAGEAVDPGAADWGPRGADGGLAPESCPASH